jgi:D-alanyl-D-alanine carboxypeptidase
MRISNILCVIFFTLFSCEKDNLRISTSPKDCNFSFADSSSRNPNRPKYQALINNNTGNGVVGITMSVYKPKAGIWLGAVGKADIDLDIDMKPCHLLRMGSTVKMFTATVILKLQEEGKLKLDDKISKYLSGDNIDKIENADKATIRQLLQHSSGIYNYIQSLKFQTASLNDLLKEWKANDLLQYAYNEKAYFVPGDDLRYSNSGYILLGLLIEKIAGKPLYQVFDEKIFLPIGLGSTSFAGKNPVPNGIARGYIDIYSNLQVIESTYYSGWDYFTADGGLISNSYDLSVFFRALMYGKIISQVSLNEMLTWKKPKVIDQDFFPISYGLGIFKIETPQGIAYMHSGDAIGYYANMIYFPSDSTTIIYAVNSNYGKIDPLISTKAAMGKIISATK